MQNDPQHTPTEADKRYVVAESFCLAYRDHTDLLNDYANTFDMGPVQVVALRRLLDLTKDLTKAEAELCSNDMTTDDAFRLCGDEIAALETSA